MFIKMRFFPTLRLSLGALVCCSAFLSLPYRPVHAQSQALTIRPAITEILIQPGKSATIAYTITNDGDTVAMKIGMADYTSSGAVASAAPDWIRIVTPNVTFDTPFVLQQGEEKEVILHIRPQTTLEEKDYYKVLLFTTEPKETINGTASTVNGQIGSILFITVNSSGILSKEVVFDTFRIPAIVDSFEPIQGTILLKNTGNTYTHPHGVLTLKGPLAKAEFIVIPSAVLPGEITKLTTENAPQNSNLSFKLTGFFFGTYEVGARITLDQSTITLEKTQRVLAFPWKLLTISIAGIVIYRIRKHGKKVKKESVKPV